MLAIAYLLFLGMLLLALEFQGEAWWLTTLGLYLPRILFAIPLPALLAAVIVSRHWRLLWVVAAGAVLVWFPLLGFVAPSPVRHLGGPTVRVLSYNADSGNRGFDKIANEILSRSPDIVLVQELPENPDQLIRALSPVYAEVRSSAQFLLATRYPVLAELDPKTLPTLHWPPEAGGVEESPRFTRWLLSTPLGPLSIYDVHPLSPRDGFAEIRGEHGLWHELRSGRLLSGVVPSAIQINSDVRAHQVQVLSEFLAHDPRPAVIAGDTNLPSLSRVFRRYLSDYRDGFREASWGFGYTYPVQLPWMRIDRILTSRELTFSKFEIGCGGASDHRCVIAEIGR